MDPMDYWRLCDELSIMNAALLFVGCDPGGTGIYVEEWSIDKRPEGYEAVKAALRSGLRSGSIEGHLRYEKLYDGYGGEPSVSEDIDVHKSTVFVHSLKEFLGKRGVRHGFFFPEGEDMPDYLNETSPCYSVKLAAALEAWKAISGNPDSIRGKTVESANLG